MVVGEYTRPWVHTWMNVLEDGQGMASENSE